MKRRKLYMPSEMRARERKGLGKSAHERIADSPSRWEKRRTAVLRSRSKLCGGATLRRRAGEVYEDGADKHVKASRGKSYGRRMKQCCSSHPATAEYRTSYFSRVPSRRYSSRIRQSGGARCSLLCRSLGPPIPETSAA